MKPGVENVLPAINRPKSVFALIALLFIASVSTQRALSFQPRQSTHDRITGTWNLAYATDEAGGHRQGRGSITLVLKTESDKLTGTAFVTGRGGERAGERECGSMGVWERGIRVASPTLPHSLTSENYVLS